MSNINITNLEAGRGAGENLKSGVINIIDSLRSDTSTFSALSSVDPSMEGNFSIEYNKSMEDIYSFLSSNIYASIMDYFGKDNTGGAEAPSGPGGTNKNYIRNGGNDYGTPEQNNDAVPAVVDIPDVPELDFKIEVKEKEDLSKIDKSPVEKMSLRDFDGMLNELIELAKLKNVTLDELLMNDKYSDSIKEVLLESPYVPQDFKEILLELDSSSIRQLFLNMLNGDYPELFDINTLNLEIMRSYLEKIAEENGITVDELLNDEKYQDLLKDTLSKYDNVIDLIDGWEDLGAQEFQDQLKSFYLGDVPEEFPNEDILATRSFVDTLANECDVSYEEFLNDVSYADTLKDGAIEYGKSMKYFETLTHTSDDMLFKNTKEVFDSKK